MTDPNIFKVIRNSRMNLEEVYFWTSTIKDCKALFKQDKYKILVLETLNSLVTQGFIAVYGFVVMPNHVHFLWEMLKMNGNKMPHASFNKATALEIRLKIYPICI